MNLTIQPTPEAAAAEAAQWLVRAAREAIAARGRFVVALSGGSTPAAMYALLGAQPLRSEVDWSHVEVFWGDERCVPPDDPASNYRLARDTLLDRVPIPAAQVHRMRGESPPDQASREYERELRIALGTGEGPPATREGGRLDLVLLGLGDDGHTASLFPGGAWMGDGRSWVRAEPSKAGPAWRITLTPTLINASAEVLFLVTGSGKADIVRRVLAQPDQPPAYPAQWIVPTRGRVTWILDAASASELPKTTDDRR